MAEETPILKEYWAEKEKSKYRIMWSEDGVEVSATHYPIYPYGNYVKHVLRIWFSEGNICLEVYGVRMNWNGTGRDDILDLCFDDHSTESPIFMWRSEVESIESAEDIKEYVKGVAEWLANLMMEISETILGTYAR